MSSPNTLLWTFVFSNANTWNISWLQCMHENNTYSNFMLTSSRNNFIGILLLRALYHVILGFHALRKIKLQMCNPMGSSTFLWERMTSTMLSQYMEQKINPLSSQEMVGFISALKGQYVIFWDYISAMNFKRQFYTKPKSQLHRVSVLTDYR